MKQEQKKYLNTKWGEVCYLESGKGPNLFVIIHGFLGTPFHFEEIAEIYVPKGFHVVAPFLPGHGSSFSLPKGFDFQDLLEVVEAFINSFKAKKVVVVGHSLGGALAWQLGQRLNEPIVKVVALDPGLGKLEKRGLRNSMYFSDLQKDYPKDWYKKFVYHLMHAGFKMGQIMHPERMVNMVRSTKVDFKTFPKTVETLVLWGNGDLTTKFETYEQDLKKVKGIKIVMHEGGHHWFVPRKELFLEELQKFV